MYLSSTYGARYICPGLSRPFPLNIWETRVQSTLAQTYSVSVVPPTDGESVNA